MSAASTAARTAVAILCEQILGVPTVATIPGTPRAGTAFVHPARGERYLDFTVDGAASFTKPALRLGVTLIAPTGSWEMVLDWIDDKVADLQEGLLLYAEPLTPGVRRPWVVAVGEPGILDAGSNLAAVVLELSPIYLSELST